MAIAQQPAPKIDVHVFDGTNSKRIWAVFTVAKGRAQFKAIEVGHNNGIRAQVLNGVKAGDRVILYPGPGITDGVRVEERRLN